MSTEGTSVRGAVAGGPAANSRRLDIQGLRAVAVIAVVAFHAGLPIPGGFIGVDVFFVISGFVITGMLHREESATGRVRFLQFYWRRFKRLTPALALMIVVVMVGSSLVLSPLGPQQNAAKTAIGAMLLVANFVIASTTGGYFDAPAETNPLLNTWSLSVEEQFYVLFPALIALGWYLARRGRFLRASPSAIVGAISVLSLGLAFAGAAGLAFRDSEHSLGFYSPFTRAWEFAAGALLALALARRVPQSPALTTGAGILGLLILAVGLWTITDAKPFPGPWTLIPVTSTLLLIFAGTNHTAPTSRLLSTHPLVQVGDWSYSIYLWNWPIIVFAVLLWPHSPLIPMAAALVSLVPALASYHWVEQPIRHLRITSRDRALWLIATTLLVPMGLAMALSFAASQGWWSQEVRQLQAATIPWHIGLSSSCDTRAPLNPRSVVTCVWNRDDTGPPIYLVGDSNADHFSEGFIAAGRALGRPVYIATTNACPFIDLELSDLSANADNTSCRTYVQQSLASLETARTGLVVISNIGGYWSSAEWAVSQPSGEETTDSSIKMMQFRKALANTVAGIRRDGHQVLLVQTVPHWVRSGLTLWEPSRCSMVSILRGSCAAQRPLDQFLAEKADVRAVIDSVARESGATVWDPAGSLCPDSMCSTAGPGYIRYRDADHISVPQANALAPVIQELLGRVSPTAPPPP